MAKEHLKKGNKATQFTSENQPSPEAKSLGRRKKRTLKELAEIVVEGKGLEKAKQIAKRLGIPLEDDEFTAELIMTLRLIEKAINLGDVSAYSAVMDRMKGKPKQSVDVTSGGDKINVPSDVVFKTP